MKIPRQGRSQWRQQYQGGLSITGLFFILIILGAGGLFAARVIPTVSEYFSIMRIIETAKVNGTSVLEIRTNFDRQSYINGVSAITGKDLDISKNGEQLEISFAYQQKIKVYGPVSVLIDYAGSTDKNTKK
jgi:hypothetical protein